MTEKGCLDSMVVDGETGEEHVAGNRSSPELVVGGRAKEENGTVIMEEAAPLDMVKSPVTSNHGNKESRSVGKRECQKLRTVS